MWIIFEGLDKSGKGTLEWEILKATNFKHIIVDRGPVGYAVFDIVFGRDTTAGNMGFLKNISLMKANSDDFMVVYCKVPVDIAMQRIKEHNETCPYDYESVQKIYDYYIDAYYKERDIQVIEVDTTKPIKECVDFIVDCIKLK